MPVLYRLSRVIAFLVYSVFRVRRRVVEDNLARSFPEKTPAEIRELSRRVYRNYADVLVEMLRASRMDPGEFRERVHFEGDDAPQAELDAGRPVLVLLGHQCNVGWMLLASCLRFDYPVDTVYRPLSNPAMEKFYSGMFSRFGSRLVDDRSVIRAILKRRTETRFVAMVCDQAPNVRDEVYWGRFLGRETGFHLAPGIIARFTGYPVYFLGMRRRGRGEYTVSFQKLGDPPYDDPQAVMPVYVHALEAQVLAAPEDWFWMHRRWKRPRSVYRNNGEQGAG